MSFVVLRGTSSTATKRPLCDRQAVLSHHSADCDTTKLRFDLTAPLCDVTMVHWDITVLQSKNKKWEWGFGRRGKGQEREEGRGEERRGARDKNVSYTCVNLRKK